MKRFVALLLVCALFLGAFPGVFAAEAEAQPDSVPLTEEDYLTADLMWEALYEKEEAMSAKKAPVSQTVEALITTVTSSPYYQEDSLIRNGNHFFWETTDGIPCGYSPRLSSIGEKAQPLEDYDAETAQTVLTTSYASKSGYPGGKNVYLIQPYYGLDSDFTTQYVTEANNIAKKTGGTATTYRTTSATIDNIANAIEQGAVVIFDSHGDTDYINPNDEYDFATRANTSYICLQTNSGITEQDCKRVTGKYNSYYNAYYAGYNGSMKFYCVNGTAIANHMDKNSSDGLLWMAICLSMTTDGLQAPLRKKGVEVAYGYSQSVTFDYDYAWEEVFWDNMIAGKTVSQAISAMKSEVGLWDYCHSSYYDTIAEAREEYCAFPIVVSDQDTYPGHGKVDALQTVQSNWTLVKGCTHSYGSKTTAPTCSNQGYTTYTCSKCGHSYTGNYTAALGHNYTKKVTAATCTAQGYTTYTCSRCSYSYTGDYVLAEGHSYSAKVTAPTCTAQGYTTYACTRCGNSYKGSYVNATGHTYSAKVTAPTCTAQGYTTYTCTGCGNSYKSEYVSATGHSYSATYAAPTCTQEGGTVHTCKLCGYSYLTDAIAPIGHSYAEGFCTVCGRPDLPENPFTDVKEEEYYGYPVLWALQEGITTGTSATTFRPDKTCTRGQIVTFLWRAAGEPEPQSTANPFTDVSSKDYYYKAVLWAVEQGITNGTGKGKFSPDRPCTRGQVATFLWRFRGEPAPASTENPFSDILPTDYYYDAILWAVEKEITNGTGKGKFSPNKDCTRGQIVTFLYRLFQKIEEEGVTLRFWQAGGEDEEASATMRLLLDKFEQRNPGITVEYTTIPWAQDPHTVFETAIAEEDCADLLVLGSPLDFQLAGEGKLLALDSLLSDEVLSDLPDVLKSQGIYRGKDNEEMNGKIMSVPLYGGSRAMLYNKEIFDYFGVEYPTEGMSHAELLEVAKALTGSMNGKTVYGYGTRATTSEQYLSFVWNYGAQIVDPSTMTAATNSEAWRKGMEDYVAFYQSGTVHPDSAIMDGGSLAQLFVNGEVAMFIAAVDYAMEIRDAWELAGKADNLGVAPLVGEDYATCYCGTDVMVVPAATEYPEETGLLLSYLMSTEAQVAYSKAIDFFPCVKSAIADPYFANDPILSGYAKAMEGGHYFDNYGVPGVGTLLKNNLQMLLKGELTVEEYQAKLTDEINSKIAEIGE